MISLFFFSNFSHGQIRENLLTLLEIKEDLSISTIAKFESDLLKTNEDNYSSLNCDILQMFVNKHM